MGAGTGAGFFWQAGLMAGLKLGQARRCSSYFDLGSAVPAPMFLGTQPPNEMKALTNVKFRQILNVWKKSAIFFDSVSILQSISTYGHN